MIDGNRYYGMLSAARIGSSSVPGRIAILTSVVPSNRRGVGGVRLSLSRPLIPCRFDRAIFECDQGVWVETTVLTKRGTRPARDHPPDHHVGAVGSHTRLSEFGSRGCHGDVLVFSGTTYRLTSKGCDVRRRYAHV